MEKCWDNVINPAMENIDEYSSLVEPYFTEEKGIRYRQPEREDKRNLMK